MLVPPSPIFLSGTRPHSDPQQYTNAVKFIQQVCRKLRFPIRTLSTACDYFHLFYQNSFAESIPPSDIALTAILLASKSQETYKRIREILQAAFLVTHPDFKGRQIEIGEESRRTVVQYEESMLAAIGFKFSHRLCPFKILVGLGRGKLGNGGDVMQRAWRSMLRLYESAVVLQYPGAYLALACIIKARRELKMGTSREDEYIRKTRMHGSIIDSITSTL